MNNKIKYLFLTLSLFLLTSLFNINVYAMEDESEVSLRELAVLASLAYEPAPDTALYKDATGGNYCTYNSDNTLTDNEQNAKYCRYTYSDDDMVTWNTSKEYSVHRYIEGMSERRLNFVTNAMSQVEESGTKYHFFNYANYDEFDDWYVSNVSKRVKSTDSQLLTGFYGITFRKGDNYVIAFRGTDLPDLFEWIDDLFIYGMWSKSTENDAAYKYAQYEYNRIVSSNPNAKIYVTGHSLGAYLAEIGGAAIADLGKDGANTTNVTATGSKAKTYETMDSKEFGTRNGLTIDSYSDYEEIYCHNKNSKTGKCYNSNLVQVAYFNGMGVSAMNIGANVNIPNNYIKSISNALVYLSTHLPDGTLVTKDNVNQKYSLLSNNTAIDTLNYSDKVYSSGRLVLYSMQADIVTGMGVHFGEIVRMKPALDSVDYHKTVNTTAEESESEAISTIEKIDGLKEKLAKVKETYNNSQTKKYIESVSDMISMLIYSNTDSEKSESTSSSSDVVPDAVLNAVNRKYNIQSGINLTRALYLAADEFSAGGFSTAMNIGHETDSFLCAMDKENGTPKINLTVSGYELESDSIVKVYDNTTITLEADVTEGCATSYKWYKIVNGSTTEIDNNHNYLTVKSSDIVSGTKYYVVMNYGTYYGEMTLDSASNDFNYKEHELSSVSKYDSYSKKSNTIILNRVSNTNNNSGTNNSKNSSSSSTSLTPICEKLPSTITLTKTCTVTKKAVKLFGRTLFYTVSNKSCTSYTTDSYTLSCRTSSGYKLTNDTLQGNVKISNNAKFLIFGKKFNYKINGKTIKFSVNTESTSGATMSLKGKVCDKLNNCIDLSTLGKTQIEQQTINKVIYK